MTEFELRAQALEKLMLQSEDAQPKKRRRAPAASQASQTLTISGGVISGVGLAAPGATVNITHNHQNPAKDMAQTPPSEE